MRPSNYFIEVLCAILLGSIPATILLLTQSFESVVENLSGIVEDELLYYYAAIAFLPALFLKLANVQSPSTRFPEPLESTIRQVFSRIGTTILGTYRIFAGSIIVLVPPILVFEQNLTSFYVMILTLIFAVASIVLCVKVEQCFRRL
ncbi:hypothetical protein Q4520_21195 [Alteromonas sp. 1_MG-2023]|uniref:hypothetical protein n=1 Tax=Alteromonas sp. 1_MG-2023 TaxID=3062669 RepID=UPI0026E18920|nr:hypothetical protein [Alteromonas sp. 1_MG-2023]MDO6477940.1 hypothetical protein [Alteromonas sp. 1_MG-2023]